MRGEDDSGPGPPRGGDGLGADIALGLLCAGIAILARLALHPVVGFTLPYTTVFLTVSLLALWRGWRAAAFCTAVALPLAVTLFVDPVGRMSLPTFGDRAALVGFLIVTTAVIAVGDASRRGLLRAQHAAIDARRAEASLRESEERYRRLVELSPDAIFVSVDRRITYVNEAMVRLFGARAPADLVGRAVQDLITR